MAKIKLTRNELKSQREALARFTRFLPTLELKKMQLQMEKRKIERAMEEVRREAAAFRDEISGWQKLFGDAHPKPLYEMVHIKEVVTQEENIAGISIPVYRDVVFAVESYDLLLSPPWYETGIKAIENMIRLHQRLNILERQSEIIELELRKTTQRINLFREKLIPLAKDNIRRIRIYLGDMQAAAVGRAKIAKQKLQKVGG